MADFDNLLAGHSFGGYMRDGGLYRDKAPAGEGGGKSGKKGGSSGGFTEDPNTIQSDAIFTCVDMLCEGPIVGLYYGLQSVYLNNVPLYTTNGVNNFLGIVYDWRAGYVDQVPFVGMDVVENPVIVSARFTSGFGTSSATAGGPPEDPFHFEVGQAAGPGVVNPDFIGITIQINGLTVMDTKKGVLKGSKVSFSVWCLGSDMSDYAKIGEDTISGKCTAPYQRSYVLTPVGLPPWTIKVQRDSADFTKSTEVGDTYVFSYSTIYELKLNYAYSACMSAYLDASQFGSTLPSRSYDILGLIIDVPSNYDPYSRTYSGLWDGLFVQKWTNNPAWIVYSLLANKRWGLGKKIDLDMIDKWALYTIGQYCDERVPDMVGGTECRFSFDGIIAGQQDAYAIINQVASCFRGMIYWGASGITFTQDAPTGTHDEPSGTRRACWATATNVGGSGSSETLVLASGASWSPNETAFSPSNEFEFRFQTDGNAVVYQQPGDVVLWASNTNDMGATELRMQTDGSMAIYNGGTLLFSTNSGGTLGNDGAYLVMQDDGNLVIYFDILTKTPFSSPAAIFSPANAINGDFTYEGTAEKARHSIALVTYNDPRNDFKGAIEAVEMPELIKRYGQRTIKVTAYGCSRRAQAHRFGKWILASEQLETETVTFNTGLDYADIAPGTVIGIADPHRTESSMAGRIVSANATPVGSEYTIQIDRVFSFGSFISPGYDIIYQNPSGDGVLKRNVTGATTTLDGKQQVLTTTIYPDTIADTPITGSLFAIQEAGFLDEETSNGDAIRLFRVISNKEVKTHEYQIVAVEHNPAKYDIVDEEEALIEAGGTPWSSWPVAAPGNFSAANTFGGGLASALLSWTAPQSPNPADPTGTADPRVVLYQIFQLEDATWTMISTTAGLSHNVSGLTEGDYWFAVRAITAVQIGPFAVLEDYAVTTSFPTPADVTGFTAVVSYNDATLSWDEVTTTGVSGYRITRDGALFAEYYDSTDTALYFNFSDTINHRYGIKAKNGTGGLSADETQIVFSPLVPPNPTGFRIDHIVDQVVSFAWDQPPPLGCHYEIHQGASWGAGTTIQSNIFAAAINVTVVGTPGSLLFWCETISNIGLGSSAFSAGAGAGATLFYEHPFGLVSVVASMTKITGGFISHANIGVEASLAGFSIDLHFTAEIGVTASRSHTGP